MKLEKIYWGGVKVLRNNILIVDDSQISREILISMLQDEYNVYEAEDGLEAVERLEENLNFYQLVLLDLNMSKMDGYTVLKIMRERGWLKEIPVIIISTELGIASKLGAVDFLSKPFDREIVRTRIRNVLAIYERYVLDSLTGGLNYKGFLKQVGNFLQSAEHKENYDILFFDIKNFKAINELLGIKNGDEVLRHFYKELCSSACKPLAVARIESDHFVCLAGRGDDNYHYMEELCHQNFTQNGKLFQVQAKCGIFHIDENEKEVNVSGMIDRARLAEYGADSEYKKSYMVYTPSMKKEYIDYTELSAALAQGIHNGEFQIYYQPIVNVKNGQIMSAEALVRWKHPEKGLISPGVFIPILEKNGDISKLDTHVVECVQKFQRKCDREGILKVPISVNLSGVDFHDEEMMQKLMNCVQSGTIQQQKVRFEITETSYMAMDARCLHYIRKMREQGIEILVDDFGTGYSSLSWLHNCDIDILKIDMTFVRQLEVNQKAKIILRSIIDIASQLGLKSVVEGIETKEQLEFLKDCDCDYGQGYYFYRPMPEEQFALLLMDKNKDFRMNEKKRIS